MVRVITSIKEIDNRGMVPTVHQIRVYRLS